MNYDIAALKRKMLVKYPFFGSVVANVDYKEDNNISTAETDGKTIYYNPKFLEELNGHYEETEFMPPKWLEEILESNKEKLIVIDEIDKISKEEQLKFVELLKYRKISTFSLPKGCLIIVTAHEINKETINEEIFSLVAKI